MTLVRLEPAVPRSRVKHSTTEPLRSLKILCTYLQDSLYLPTRFVLLTYKIRCTYLQGCTDAMGGPGRLGCASMVTVFFA